jgi:aspartyl aminopeptidase
MNRANAWTTYEEADLKALEELCKEYKDFLSNGKTERECVAQSIELAEKAGYQDLEELIKNQTPLKAGDKVYRTWMEKTIVLFQIGEDDRRRIKYFRSPYRFPKTGFKTKSII